MTVRTRSTVSVTLSAALIASAAALLAQAPITLTPGVQMQTPAAGVKAFIAAWDREPHVNVNVPPAPGKIVIVKFSDWECPGCRLTAMAYKVTLQTYANKINYVEKDYPLNTDCNVHSLSVMHPAACVAAEAMRLARPTGKGDQLATWLWANQGTDPDNVRAAALSIAGIDNFDQRALAVLPLIRQDGDAGAALKIRGTPAYFVNGIAVKGFQDGKLDDGALLVADLFDAAVQRELQKAKLR